MSDNSPKSDFSSDSSSDSSTDISSITQFSSDSSSDTTINMTPTIRWDDPSTWVYSGLHTELPQPSPMTSPELSHASGWPSVKSIDDIEELDLNDVRFDDLEARNFLLGNDSDDDDLSQLLPPSSSDLTFSDRELFGNGLVGFMDVEDEESSTQRNLLFSTDLQFLVRVSGNGDDKPNLTSNDLHFRIAKHLQGAGFFSPGYLQHDGTKTSAQSPANSTNGTDLWSVQVSDENHRLPENNPREDKDEDEPYFQTWKLVSILSPLKLFHPETIRNLDTLLQTLNTIPDLVIGLDHTPRLCVNIKPEENDFTLRDTKRLARFLHAASPLFDTLHAKYCGPGSLIAPGIEFAKAFHFLPFTHLSDAEWRAAPEEIVFTHGPPAATYTKMLMKPDVKRGSGIAQCAQKFIAGCEKVDEIVTAMEIRVMGDDEVVRTTPGAYDFANLVDSDPRNRTIQFRQHAGTMDFAAVENWVRVCHGVVSFAVNAPKDVFNRIMQLTQLSDSASNTYSIDHLLLEIGLRSEAEYYKSKGQNPFVPDLERLRRKPAVNLEDTPGLSPFSFGLEFEFILPFHDAEDEADADNIGSSVAAVDNRWVNNKPAVNSFKPGWSDAVAHDRDRDHLAEVFNKAGLFSINSDRVGLVSPRNYARHQRLQKMADDLGYRIEISHKVRPEYQTWLLKSDISLSGLSTGFLEYSGGINGFEMTSPVLRDQKEDFEKVLSILELIRSQARPMLDPSCGLHVHVGNVRNFSFRSLKRVLTMVWAVDPIVSTLIHPSRFDNPYSQPPHVGSNLAEDYDLPEFSEVRGEHPDKLLELEIASHLPMNQLPDQLQREFYRIWAAENLFNLKDMLETPMGSRSAVSVTSIQRIDLTSAGMFNRHDHTAIKRHDARILGGTIEFRSLEGTLDPVLVAHWVKLMLAIVEKAESASMWEFYKMMEKILVKPANEEQKLVFLLEALGLTSAQEYWAGVAAKNRALVESGEFPTLATQPDNSDGRDSPHYRRWLERSLVVVPQLPEDAGDQMRRAIS